ncbi:type II toxin-antitoxin system TacA family antitoxin [Nocardioides hungaricus]
MTTAPEANRRKQARLAVRLTPDQDALIRDAAAVTGQSLTDFVTAAAVTRAEDTLADRRVFRIDDAAWAEFSAILDRPAQRIPEFATLLDEGARWDEG